MAILREPGLQTLCVPVRRSYRATRLSVFSTGFFPARLARIKSLWGRITSAPAPVRAIRAVAGSRQWQIRLRRQWVDAVLQDSRRGPCWLDLRLNVIPSADMPRTDYRVAVWQPRVRAQTWRRLCLLVGAAQRLGVAQVRPQRRGNGRSDALCSELLDQDGLSGEKSPMRRGA